MAQDRRYARLKHKHIVADITDFIPSLTAFGDANYLRLDTTNDPLTAELAAQSIVPDVNVTRSLGAVDNRWANLFGSRIYTLQQETDLGVTWNNTIASGGSQSLNILSEAGPAFSGGTQTMNLNALSSGDAAQMNFVNISGTSKGTVDINCDLDGPGSIHALNFYCQGNGAAGNTLTVSNQLYSSLVLATLIANSNKTATVSGGNNLSQGGNILGGFCGAFFGGSTNGRIAITIGGFFTGGSVAFGFADGGTIETFSPGAWASGYSNSGGSLTTTGFGAFTTGRVTGTGSILRTNGNGAFAAGSANSAGAIIESTAPGAFSQGFADGSGDTIRASGNGAFAHGYAAGGVNIDATAQNSTQFGPGINAEADTFSVGTGIRLKGTTGAPGTPRNGDLWVATNDVIVRSGGFDVDLTPGANVYTVTNLNADRTYDANATSVAELADIVGTIIADLQARNLLQ